MNCVRLCLLWYVKKYWSYCSRGQIINISIMYVFWNVDFNLTFYKILVDSRIIVIGRKIECLSKAGWASLKYSLSLLCKLSKVFFYNSLVLERYCVIIFLILGIIVIGVRMRSKYDSSLFRLLLLHISLSRLWNCFLWIVEINRISL